MTNEEALVGFQNLYNEIDKDNHLFVGTINPEWIQMAIEALKQNQWIPCSERLPEPGEYYLVTVQFLGWNGNEYREIDIAEYEYDGWHKANTVLAWCELPKPYEGRTE